MKTFFLELTDFIVEIGVMTAVWLITYSLLVYTTAKLYKAGPIFRMDKRLRFVIFVIILIVMVYALTDIGVNLYWEWTLRGVCWAVLSIIAFKFIGEK